MDLEVTGLTNMGDGVGRVDGWVVMVPYALPGERVRVRVFRNHKNYSEADLVGVVSPSPHRIEPRCPLFGTCGGCQYQCLAYPEQLAWKRRQVAELLQRMAGIECPVEPVVPSPREFHYRSKLTPHFNKPRAPAEAPPIGFLIAGRKVDLVDVPQCPIATGAINAALPAVRRQLRARAATMKRGATLLLRDCADGVATDPNAVITEVVEGLRLQFPAGTFFQNNPFILPVLLAHVRGEASAGGMRFLVDAYCGSGLFALGCAGRFEAVAGVEISNDSVLWARRNAEANGIGNARFLSGEAAAIFEGIEFPGLETAVIIDPPRKGCDAQFLDQLFRFSPARVIYVSCNPATQIRDLKAFDAAGYHVARVVPFDLFPQTKHLECVVTLAKPQSPASSQPAAAGSGDATLGAPISHSAL